MKLLHELLLVLVPRSRRSAGHVGRSARRAVWAQEAGVVRAYVERVTTAAWRRRCPRSRRYRWRWTRQPCHGRAGSVAAAAVSAETHAKFTAQAVPRPQMAHPGLYVRVCKVRSEEQRGSKPRIQLSLFEAGRPYRSSQLGAEANCRDCCTRFPLLRLPGQRLSTHTAPFFGPRIPLERAAEASAFLRKAPAQVCASKLPVLLLLLVRLLLLRSCAGPSSEASLLLLDRTASLAVKHPCE